MQLIIITPEQLFENETELVNEFLVNSEVRVHIRKSAFALSDYRNYINSIDKKHFSQISIHENFQLIEEFSSIGIHLKSKDRKVPKSMEKLKSFHPSTFSSSFHSWEEIEEDNVGYDYVFVSPVFDSISKQGYKAAIDITKLKHVKNKLLAESKKLPQIIGLGGIDASNLSLLYNEGFDGVAILGAVWKSANPIEAFEKIQAAIARLSDG